MMLCNSSKDSTLRFTARNHYEMLATTDSKIRLLLSTEYENSEITQFLC